MEKWADSSALWVQTEGIYHPFCLLYTEFKKWRIKRGESADSETALTRHVIVNNFCFCPLHKWVTFSVYRGGHLDWMNRMHPGETAAVQRAHGKDIVVDWMDVMEVGVGLQGWIGFAILLVWGTNFWKVLRLIGFMVYYVSENYRRHLWDSGGCSCLPLWRSHHFGKPQKRESQASLQWIMATLNSLLFEPVLIPSFVKYAWSKSGWAIGPSCPT